MEHESPDPLLSREQSSLVAQLTQKQIAAIDSTLLAQCAGSWRKVSYVIGSALQQLRLPGVPDSFFALRVKEHIARSKLEGRGDLSRMHYSEARIPAASGANAP
jgi:Protein of unknown function